METWTCPQRKLIHSAKDHVSRRQTWSSIAWTTFSATSYFTTGQPYKTSEKQLKLDVAMAVKEVSFVVLLHTIINWRLKQLYFRLNMFVCSCKLVSACKFFGIKLLLNCTYSLLYRVIYRVIHLIKWFKIWNLTLDIRYDKFY